MKLAFQLLTASALAMGAFGATGYALAQDKPATVTDESKMGAKGVPGSPDTQSGKAPTDASGTSMSPGASSSGTGSMAQPAESGSSMQSAPDETKKDAKGVPGSPTTQSGKEPSK